jgi:hypothetical protein
MLNSFQYISKMKFLALAVIAAPLVIANPSIPDPLKKLSEIADQPTQPTIMLSRKTSDTQSTKDFPMKPAE